MVVLCRYDARKTTAKKYTYTLGNAHLAGSVGLLYLHCNIGSCELHAVLVAGGCCLLSLHAVRSIVTYNNNIIFSSRSWKNKKNTTFSSFPIWPRSFGCSCVRHTSACTTLCGELQNVVVWTHTPSGLPSTGEGWYRAGRRRPCGD